MIKMRTSGLICVALLTYWSGADAKKKTALDLKAGKLADEKKSEFERVRVLFDFARPAQLSQFRAEALWEGECVSKSRPNEVFPSALGVHPQSADPVLGEMLYAVPQFFKNPWRGWVSEKSARAFYNSQKKELARLTTLQEHEVERKTSSDSMIPVIGKAVLFSRADSERKITTQEIGTHHHYRLRYKTMRKGETILILEKLCLDQRGCSDLLHWRGLVPYGERYVFCRYPRKVNMGT